MNTVTAPQSLYQMVRLFDQLLPASKRSDTISLVVTCYARQAVDSHSDCVYTCASGRILIRSAWLNPSPGRVLWLGCRLLHLGFGRFLPGAGDLLFCSKRLDSSRGPPVAIFLDINRPGREAEHSLSSSVEVTYERSYSATPCLCLLWVDGQSWCISVMTTSVMPVH